MSGWAVRLAAGFVVGVCARVVGRVGAGAVWDFSGLIQRIGGREFLWWWGKLRGMVNVIPSLVAGLSEGFPFARRLPKAELCVESSSTYKVLPGRPLL